MFLMCLPCGPRCSIEPMVRVSMTMMMMMMILVQLNLTMIGEAEVAAPMVVGSVMLLDVGRVDIVRVGNCVTLVVVVVVVAAAC